VISRSWIKEEDNTKLRTELLKKEEEAATMKKNTNQKLAVLLENSLMLAATKTIRDGNLATMKLVSSTTDGQCTSMKMTLTNTEMEMIQNST